MGPQADKPNRVVKLVFEVVEVPNGKTGLGVRLEMPDRKITEKILKGEDSTVAEIWGAQTFNSVKDAMIELAKREGAPIHDFNTPNKEDMN